MKAGMGFLAGAAAAGLAVAAADGDLGSIAQEVERDVAHIARGVERDAARAARAVSKVERAAAREARRAARHGGVGIGVGGAAVEGAVVAGAALAASKVQATAMRRARNAHRPAILVENIELHVSDKAFYEAFAQFGRIEFCQILRLDTGASQGQGFVHYASAEEAQAAVAVVEGDRNFVLPGGTAPVKCRHHAITLLQLQAQTQAIKQYRYTPG